MTAAVTAAAAYWLFDVSRVGALLLGAVVGSTDAAAVFATLRFTALRHRLAALLNAESGANDPTAVALTIGLITWLTRPHYGAVDVVLLVARQLTIGDTVTLIGARAERLGDRLQAVTLTYAIRETEAGGSSASTATFVPSPDAEWHVLP